MKWKAVLCLVASALLMALHARAAEDAVITVDGEPLPVEHLLEDGRLYVPLSPLLEALTGCEPVWDEAGRAAAQLPAFTLTVPVGEGYVLADSWSFDIGSVTRIRDGQLYVPLRSVANLLGAEVEFVSWDVPVTVTSAEAPGSYTEEDLYWLSRVICAESGAESLRGQVAVGNVVLERVADGEFPDTIREVVFDRKDAVQFEPVENGTIYQEPTEQSVFAAQLVLSGATAVEDCLYFFAPALSQGTWIRQNCTYYTTIGCHRFYQRQPEI